MAIANIKQPFIISESTSGLPAQRQPYPETASSIWLPYSFVFTSGTGASVVLNNVLTAGTVIYGMSPDAAISAGGASPVLTPPNALFGLNHYCFEVADRIIEMNAAASAAGDGIVGTTNGVTWNGGGTNGVALAPGQQYGIYVPTTGTYIRTQLMDVSNTTQKLFTLISIAPGQALTDANPRVWVKPIITALQGY